MLWIDGLHHLQLSQDTFLLYTHLSIRNFRPRPPIELANMTGFMHLQTRQSHYRVAHTSQLSIGFYCSRMPAPMAETSNNRGYFIFPAALPIRLARLLKHHNPRVGRSARAHSEHCGPRTLQALMTAQCGVLHSRAILALACTALSQPELFSSSLIRLTAQHAWDSSDASGQSFRAILRLL